MNTSINHEEDKIEIDLDIEASAEKVFSALTKPELITQWMGPEDFQCTKAEFDARVGGHFKIQIKGPESDHTAYGEVKKLQPYSFLEYSWQWEDGTFENSLVQIRLEEKGKVTNLHMTHSLLPNNDARESHAGGWTGSYKKLKAFLSE